MEPKGPSGVIPENDSENNDIDKNGADAVAAAERIVAESEKKSEASADFQKGVEDFSADLNKASEKQPDFQDALEQAAKEINQAPDSGKFSAKQEQRVKESKKKAFTDEWKKANQDYKEEKRQERDQADATDFTSGLESFATDLNNQELSQSPKQLSAQEQSRTASKEDELSDGNIMGEGWEVVPEESEKKSLFAKTAERLRVEGKDISKMETPLLAKAAKELKAKQEENMEQKGPLTTVEGLISRVEEDKAKAEKRNMIEEAKQIVEENTSSHIESLTRKLQAELGDNLMVERAGLTDKGFEIVITNQNGEPIYDINALPQESLATYNELKSVLTEELKSQHGENKVDAAVAKGEADAKAKSGLWGRVKKFFGFGK